MNQEIQQYQSDDARITLDVRVENDTVWLTQAQMAQLFNRDISVISRHIRNIFQIGELEQKRNLYFLQIANSDKPTAIYSLDDRSLKIPIGNSVRFNHKVLFPSIL